MSALAGRTILLTGASRGIGAATARVLGAQGAGLVAHYGSHREGAEEAVAALPETDRLLVQADLSGTGLRPRRSGVRRSRGAAASTSSSSTPRRCR